MNTKMKFDVMEVALEACQKEAARYAVEGADFGPLLGTGFRFPKRPWRWTVASLNGLKEAQLSKVRSKDTQRLLGAAWDRIMSTRRNHLVATVPFNRTQLQPVPDDVLAEWLASGDEEATWALAENKYFTAPSLALAGVALHEALLCAVHGKGNHKGTKQLEAPFVGGIALEASSIVDALERDRSIKVTLPMGVQFTRKGDALQIDTEALTGMPARTLPWGALAQEHVTRIVEALRLFVLEAVQTHAEYVVMGHRVTMNSSVGIAIPVKTDSTGTIEGFTLGASGHLTRTAIHRLQGNRTINCDDHAERERLAAALVSIWQSSGTSTIGDRLESICRIHQGLVSPLVPEPASSLRATESVALHQAACERFETVAQHVTVLDSEAPSPIYRVTRHDITSYPVLAETDNVHFAIALALATEVSHPFSLRLAAS